MSKLQFEVEKQHWHARAWTITLNGIKFQTPVFMPVWTKATIKWLILDMLRDPHYLWDVPAIQMILANTYHLYLRPGSDIIKDAWWIHTFENRPWLILTDSGWFQAFSLGWGKKTKTWESLAKNTREWVHFRSIHDWSKHMFTPTWTVDIQCDIGSDIMMMLDVCSAPWISQKKFAQDMRLTHTRAKEQYEYHQSKYDSVRWCLFPIVQWWLYEDLRQESIDTLSNYAHDGIAVWWVSVWESWEDIKRVTAFCWPKLPHNKPRYLMWIWNPAGIRYAIQQGFDMFDCVLPTRLWRHWVYFCWDDLDPNDIFWEHIDKNNSQHNEQKRIWLSENKHKHERLTRDCQCYTCRTYTKAYLHHLHKEKEMLAWTLLSLHNIVYLHNIVTNIRKHIVNM